MTPAVTQTVTTDIPWGIIIPSGVAGLLGVLYFILALLGRAPAIRWVGKGKNLGVEPGAKRPNMEPDDLLDKKEVDIKSIQLVQLVSKRRYEMLNTAWARHTAAISSVVEDQFFPIFHSVVDRWQIMAAWERFSTVLRDVVNFNHIIDEVYVYTTDGHRVVNQDYLEEKMRVFRIRYSKLLMWPSNSLPIFNSIEPAVQDLLLDVLEKFHEISTDEQDKLIEFVTHVKQTTDSQELRLLLDTVSEVSSSDTQARLTPVG